MNIYQKLLITAMFFTTIAGCANCSGGDVGPNIRTISGIEYCGDMCNKLKDMNCIGYFEDIEINCDADPVYKTMVECADGGVGKLSCLSFCKYEMSSSINLNPKCIVDTLKSCDQIENICK